LWISVRVMSLRTWSGQPSFPGADEENDDRRGADDGGRDGDPPEGADHQA
jgi:hypothetical protein